MIKIRVGDYVMQEQVERQTERRRQHRFIASLPARFSDRPHYIYICVCGYAEATPAAGGAPLALDADFKPRSDAGGIVTHLDLVRAHEIN
ncbi:MAG TPA: hypothetical protein VHY56_14840 [Candidatus Binataceae bacterium]|nr:hypothetical protein [Candidatus Binataceae bacterium]